MVIVHIIFLLVWTDYFNCVPDEKKIIFDNSEQLKFGRYGLAGKHNFQERGGGYLNKKYIPLVSLQHQKEFFNSFIYFQSLNCQSGRMRFEPTTTYRCEKSLFLILCITSRLENTNYCREKIYFSSWRIGPGMLIKHLLNPFVCQNPFTV